MKKGSGHFWLRIASALIDLSAIYCLSIIFRFMVWHFGFVGLGSVFTAVYLAYWPAAYLLLRGRSPAKLLTGLSLRSKTGGVPALQQVLMREIGLKGLLGIVIPAFLVPHLYRVWSPIFTLLLEAALLLLSVLVLLVFKTSWWDMLAKTVLIKAPAVNWQRQFAWRTYTLLILPALIIIIKPAYSGRSHFASTFFPAYPETDETTCDAAYIIANGQKPVDYVFELFKKYDLVVLSERYHPEYTQYQLIFSIIHDPRFTSEVGNIYTELGSVSFQDTLNTFLHTRFKNEDDLNKNTAILQRNSDALWPIWDLSNRFDFLKQVNQLNSTLPDSAKLNWYFADVPVHWESMTRANYKQGLTALKRDSLMAVHIIAQYKRNLLNQHRTKGLVILNTNHGYALLNHQKDSGIGWVDSSTTNYLNKALPGKVANVMLNTVTTLFLPVQQGKWETAFNQAGNPETSFDFKGSPFGSAPWDGFFLTSKGLTYQDVFTGFIFYRPLNQQLKRTGFPHELDGYADTLLKKAACVDEGEVKRAKQIISLYRNNPKLLLNSAPAPYALLINVVEVVIIPSLLLIIYLIGWCFLLFSKGRSSIAAG